MAIRINDTVPDFGAETDHGSIQFHDWIGDQWAILFSHPKDFTPVCTTEFSAVAQLADQWQALNTKVIGLSVDGVEQHVGWKKDIQIFGGAEAEFPIIADHDLRISKLFDMLLFMSVSQHSLIFSQKKTYLSTTIACARLSRGACTHLPE